MRQADGPEFFGPFPFGPVTPSPEGKRPQKKTSGLSRMRCRDSAGTSHRSLAGAHGRGSVPAHLSQASKPQQGSLRPGRPENTRNLLSITTHVPPETRETRAASRATDSGGFGDLVIRTRCVPCHFDFVPFPTQSAVLFLSFFPRPRISATRSQLAVLF